MDHRRLTMREQWTPLHENDENSPRASNVASFAKFTENKDMVQNMVQTSEQNFNRTAYLVGTTAILSALIGFGTGALIATPNSDTLVIPACSTENDPHFCYWDADSRNNGIGSDFIHLGNGHTITLPTPNYWEN